MIWQNSQTSREREKKMLKYSYIITESCIPNGLIITVYVCECVYPSHLNSQCGGLSQL